MNKQSQQIVSNPLTATTFRLGLEPGAALFMVKVLYFSVVVSLRFSLS